MHTPTTPIHPSTHPSSEHGSNLDYEEPIWNQATLEAIDAIEAKHLDKLSQTNPSRLSSEPHTPSPTHLQVQLEDPIKNHPQPPPLSSNIYYHSLHQRFNPLHPNYENLSSLYSRFRRDRNLLSVSDLVSCVWCQYQVEYGLLGKRYLRPSQRPKSFISSSGIEIKVNSNLVLSRQKILDGGKRVHAKLEKEVAPEKVRVKVVTPVDTWGLKIVNTITNLSLLRSTGMMREINVWGFIGGFLVQGIIDQIDLIPDPSTGDLPVQPSPNSDNQNDLLGPPSNTTCQSSGAFLPVRDPRKRLLARISDSKTTQSVILPPPEHTDSARYQLMLYKYLHDQNASGRFDLDRFGTHLGLDLDESFSPFFLRDAEPLILSILESFNEDEEVEFTGPKTLRSMLELYHRMIRVIGVSDETLEIVFRKRGGRKTDVADSADCKKLKLNHVQPAVQINPHDPAPTTNPTHPLPTPNPSADPIELPSNADSINPSCQINQVKQSALKPEANEKLMQDSKKSIRRSVRTRKKERRNEENSDKKISCSIDQNRLISRLLEKDFSKFSSVQMMKAKLDTRDENDPMGKKIIGSYEFDFHPIEFSKFIVDTLRFWNGDQDPVGVEVTEFNKCQHCEFSDGCEWRSKMSNQILDSSI